MADQRKHRGPHPEDVALFAAEQLPSLQAAAGDLAWLLSGGYVVKSALKLVGDRYSLKARQRTSVSRAVASQADIFRRQQQRVMSSGLSGEPIWLDGYNVLTSIEAALAGGVLLKCQDETIRDMASMHGSYRKVEETQPAIELIGSHLESLNVGAVRWLLDQPVSNSGRLKGILEDAARQRSWDWQVDLVPDPDPILAETDAVVATADSEILNRTNRWYNLVAEIVTTSLADAWVVDLSQISQFPAVQR